MRRHRYWYPGLVVHAREHETGDMYIIREEYTATVDREKITCYVLENDKNSEIVELPESSLEIIETNVRNRI